MQLQIAENWSVYNEDVWLQHPVPTMVSSLKPTQEEIQCFTNLGYKYYKIHKGKEGKVF